MSKLSNKDGSKAYLSEGRLEDVLALLQVLGLGPEVQRSEKSLESALLNKPQSAQAWLDIARSHSEFFRAYPSPGPDGHLTSLVSRRLMPAESRGPLPTELVNGMMQTAVGIHDTQLKRRQILKVAWAGGIFLALSTLASLLSAVAAFTNQ